MAKISSLLLVVGVCVALVALASAASVASSPLEVARNMLKMVQSLHGNAVTAVAKAKEDYENANSVLALRKSDWETAFAASDKAKSTCTTATHTRIADESNKNSAITAWKTRKAQNKQERDMVNHIKKVVKELIAIPETSGVELSKKEAAASDLAKSLLQHSSDHMQLVGQSLVVLLNTKRNHKEAQAILQLLDQLLAKLRSERIAAKASIKTLTLKSSSSSTAAVTACETSRIRSIEADTAKSQLSKQSIRVEDLKAALDRSIADLKVAAADLRSARAAFDKLQDAESGKQTEDERRKAEADEAADDAKEAEHQAEIARQQAEAAIHGSHSSHSSHHHRHHADRVTVNVYALQKNAANKQHQP